MSRKVLRAVSEGERQEKPLSAVEAAEKGDTRALMVAMRNRIAREVDNPNTPGRDLASLTKRLADVVREIEAIDARDEQDSSGPSHVVEDAFDASAI